MAWTNEDLAAHFGEVATLLKVKGEDAFRVRAYERAAAAIGAASVDLGTVEPDALTDVKGIGDSTARKIREYRETGRIGMLEDLRAAVPAGVVALTRVPGLGPKTAVMLHAERGIDSVEALQAALEAGELRGLPGLGRKTEQNLLESLQRLGAKDTDRRPVADVAALAEELVERLAALPAVDRVAYAGSLRRGRETIGDLDLLVASHHDPGPIMEAFRSLDLVQDVLVAGAKKSSVLLHRGIQADLRIVVPDAWGAALVYFTGSKAHNIRIRERAVRRGLLLNEYGLFRRRDEQQDEEVSDAGAERLASRTETDVYEALGMPTILPALREDTGEVEAAVEGRLPRVVQLTDIRGDLHGHSDHSGDGKASLQDMARAAEARGHEYWAVTDHAEGLPMNGLTTAGMLARRDAIRALQDRVGVRLLEGAELNIDGDGGIDYDDELLLSFEWCVASIHTLMTRPREEQTERICRAMHHPAVNVIGHPTGRKIGRRPGYDLDLDRVLATALATGTALEVNSSPQRLDLSAEMVRRAVDAGVMLTISCDAHSVGDLAMMHFGVTTAQRGWAPPEQVLNTRDLDGLLTFVNAKRERAGAPVIRA